MRRWHRQLTAGNGQPTTARPGFTLIEMVVTIGLVVMIASIALPSIISLFSAGADSQAHNLFAAQLAAARALAIQEETYAGVHVQMGVKQVYDGSNWRWKTGGNWNETGTCWAAVVMYSASTGVFTLADGFMLRKLPGNIAFGELNITFVNSGKYQGLTDTNLPDFTTFTIVFSPSGAVVRQVNGNDISLDTAAVPFADASDTGKVTNAIWAGDSDWLSTFDEPGATAITMFDYSAFKSRDDSGRADYLDESGQFLPVNVYTGQLFKRE